MPATKAKNFRASNGSQRKSNTPSRQTAKKTARRTAKKTARSRKAPDAISLLKSDHREVEGLFAQFEKTNASDRKKAIVGKICDALSVHAEIEEKIFYPRAREALKRAGQGLLDEADVEHEGIKWKVAELKNTNPTEDRYHAKVTVLKEYVQHHVKEEERELFPKLRASEFDAAAVGEQLAIRKEALTGKPVKEEPTLIERGLRALVGGDPAPRV